MRLLFSLEYLNLNYLWFSRNKFFCKIAQHNEG